MKKDKLSIIQVLGSILQNPSLIIDENYPLTDKDFPERFHKIVFGAMDNLIRNGIQKLTEISIDEYLSNASTITYKFNSANQTYYFDRFGRNELFFLPQSEEENYQSYFVEHFYYHNSYDDGDNYFDASNVLDLYEFKTDTILVDGELKKLQTGPTYVLKDQVTGKYLVSKEIYETLEASVKPYFEIYSNVIKIGESAENYSEIDLTLEDEVDFTYICIPNGVYLNCSYKTRDITYAMEDYTTDNTFQGYKENYDNLLEAINKNNFAIDEDYALDITNIESIIHWYQENLVTELINNGSSQEYQAKSQEYLNALEFYEQYLTCQIDVNLVNLSNFTNLEAIAYEILYNIDDARNSYYSTYEKYLKRLSFLIDKYREGGDYAND